MNLYPAIDLKDGQCVRLVHGKMDTATVFNDDPGAQAARFADTGVRWIHVVDLNGAFAGRPVNGAAVEAIIAAVAGRNVSVQLGGGIRDLATIESWLERGLSRVILGTVALRDPDLVKQACRLFPGQVAVGIDARDGLVAVEGWAEVSTLTAAELGLRFEDAGAAVIIHTDISRDGAMQGANVTATAALAMALSTPVILSGGVTNYEDLRAARDHAALGIEGVITGRAVYDGRIDLIEALRILANEDDAQGATPC